MNDLQDLQEKCFAAIVAVLLLGLAWCMLCAGIAILRSSEAELRRVEQQEQREGE
jgi:hypothetical protein